jgi:ABC-type bacteriocin/lantibiotic exporter with double-glycine peptidase domain
MNKIGGSRFTIWAALCWIAFLNAPVGLTGVTDPPSDIAKYDCGTIALHTLLALDGRATPIDTLRTRLPAPSSRGHSMAELRDAARSFGLTLTGVKLSRSGRAPDRPALVFLKRDDHGHFLVVRPVGHSGKLIQIIDSTGDPIVRDAVDLYASPQWTGLALVPARPNWPLRVAVSLLTVSGLVFVVLLLASRYLTVRGTPGTAQGTEAKA